MSSLKHEEQVSTETFEGQIVDAKNVTDGDLAMAIAEESAGLEVDERTYNRLLRKIDFIMLTVLSLISAFQYMDKSSSNYASVMGIKTDLKMVGNQYNWVGTSFYLGFLIFEIPTSWSLQRLPLSKITSAYVILWGVVLCLTSLVHKYSAFIVTRTILGILESSITPAMVLFMSQWYKREEQFFRTAILVAWNGIGGLVGASISYALYKRELEGTLSMDAWRIMFIIVGLITIINGVLIVLIIPDVPSKAWWLTKEEKLYVVERIRSNKQGYGNRHIKWEQIFEALRDPRLYLYFFLQVAVAIPNGGFSNFSAQMIAGLGYSKGKALLMGMPTSGISFVALVFFGYLSTIRNRRLDIAFVGLGLNLIAGCLMAFAKPLHAQLGGYYIFGISPIPYICILSCIASNSAGHSKKVFMGAVSMIGYCTGNLIGPQTFKESQAPHYQGAKTAIVACYCIAFVILAAIYIVNVRENKRRDSLNEKLPLSIQNAEFADLTDFQNPEFRYAI
ncbi:LANO_0H25158g1_1 [Lachancea nothofagi CBS 11611]|uniref:LANO_0H25158g1_1 n=1 Tax=Lachancea nothofagi CBS 11611 TaxID=1266666 RepID=A0A1G4KP22_9SACH|nr:LANO_0H25158g1_1 [Lachancea nothofagi CBS 11611]